MSNVPRTGLIIAAILLISFNSFAEGSEKLAPESTVEEIKHGYWNDPNVDYVSTALPIDNEGLINIMEVPLLEKGFISTAPTDRNDGVIVGELGVDGSNKDMIAKLAQEMSDGKHGDFNSLLITHKDKLVFESYYLYGRLNLAHPQASATKTYTGLALGRAIQLGYMTMADLDKPLVSFLTELDSSKFVDGAEKVTLHQALTMHTGIRINNEKGEKFKKYRDQLKGQKLVQAIFEQSDPITSESQRSFSYGNYSTPLVMQVIEAVVPGTAEDFIKTELLGKMGITNYEWRTGMGGLPTPGGKSSFSSRDMMKFGTLAMNRGIWNGEQLIPQAYISKATSRVVGTGEDIKIFGGGKDVSNQGYGYFWWNADLKVGDRSYFSTSAQGGSGQFIILVEELDLIIVATGAHRGSGGKNLQIAAERILPAFIHSSISTMNLKDHSQDILSGPYIGQKLPGLTPEVFAPGIVSTEYHEWGVGFTPDMKEFYFSRKNIKTGKTSRFVFKSNNNRWHRSEIEPELSGDISPDGKMFYLNQYRERTDDGWSELKSLGPAFENIDIMRLTTSLKGTYVFDEFPIDGKGNIRYSRLINGERELPKSFNKEINTGKNNVHPFIAPDESYLLWDSEREGGYGDSDIYISFRQKDGSWGVAINLGDKVNTSASQRGGYVTPDGKYLFFNSPDSSGNGDIFWVDARIIETVRPNL